MTSIKPARLGRILFEREGYLFHDFVLCPIEICRERGLPFVMSEVSKRVLIVDDDSNDVFFLHRALSKLGIENVDSVTNSDDAIKFVTKEPPFQYEQRPDIIFSDLNIYKDGAREFLDMLKGDYEFKNIPVVILSGVCDPVEKQRLLDAGVDFVFAKPESVEVLSELVHTVFDGVFPVAR